MKEQYKLKQGDMVVMHTCMEHDHPDNFGKIWTCRSDEFQHKGHDYGSIFLDGFSGSFSTEFLQKVNVSELIAEKDEAIKELHERASHYAAVRDNAVEYGYEQAQEIKRLRKALEAIKNSTGIGYEAAWRYAVELAENALK